MFKLNLTLMKKQLLSLLIGIPVMLSAQHTLQRELHLPRVGDELIKQQVEYKDPGRSGDNVLWDFSRLTSINDTCFAQWDTLKNYRHHRHTVSYNLCCSSLIPRTWV